MKPNTWAMLCHLTALTGYLGNGIGLIVGPLVVWIIKKDEMPIVDQHGKEALNFNISVLIYGLGLGVLTFLTLGLAFFITVPLAIALMVFHVACVIMASLKANNGEPYAYPLCIRFIA